MMGCLWASPACRPSALFQVGSWTGCLRHRSCQKASYISDLEHVVGIRRSHQTLWSGCLCNCAVQIWSFAGGACRTTRSLSRAPIQIVGGIPSPLEVLRNFWREPVFSRGHGHKVGEESFPNRLGHFFHSPRDRRESHCGAAGGGSEGDPRRQKLGLVRKCKKGFMTIFPLLNFLFIHGRSKKNMEKSKGSRHKDIRAGQRPGQKIWKYYTIITFFEDVFRSS